MATAEPLDGHLTCSVCFEQYTDPHFLKECFHTFCMKCIKQLEERQKVLCPQCRVYTNIEDVKKDFKLQGIIDAVYQENEDINSVINIESKICGMCNDVKKDVEVYCKQCSHLMCNGCNIIHQRMKLCQLHTVKSTEKLMNSSKGNFRQLMQEFKEVETKLNHKSNKIDENIEEILKVQRNQIVKLKQLTDNIVKTLRENEKHLEKVITEANSIIIEDLKQQKDIISKTISKVEPKISSLNDLIQCDDYVTIMGSTESINKSMKECIENAQVSLSETQSNVLSQVSVTRVESWDAVGGIQVKVDGVVHIIQHALPVSKPLYTDLLQLTYIQSKSLDLGYDPEQLCMVNNDIWCGGNDKITVYNQNCQKVKTIMHDKIDWIRGLIKTHTKHVTVACSNKKGLHQLDTTGQYQTQISPGSFSDVCAYNEELCALECEQRQIIVFKYSNQWTVCREIKLHYNNASSDDKLLVHDSGIYTSSWHNRCVYLYNSFGQFQQDVTCSSKIVLCGVDIRSNILVSEYFHKKLKLYNRDTSSWEAIKLQGEIEGASNAIMDGQNIWVADCTGKKIIKFTKP